MKTRTFSSVLRILLLNILAVIWLYPNQVYSQPGNQTGNCDPAYPSVCIASPPPDLNCPDVPDTDFKVLPPDPHGFDQEGDGIGCETGLQP